MAFSVRRANVLSCVLLVGAVATHLSQAIPVEMVVAAALLQPDVVEVVVCWTTVVSKEQSPAWFQALASLEHVCLLLSKWLLSSLS